MDKVYLGIGSNIGNAKARVQDAIVRLGQLPAIELMRTASLYGSKPFGPVKQNDFVNTVVELRTSLEPADLLGRLKQLEAEMGRVHGTRWGPREIDLDILIYGNQKIQTENLCLPHPGIAERAFVLAPLAELDPELELPEGINVFEACCQLPLGLVWLLDEPQANVL